MYLGDVFYLGGGVCALVNCFDGGPILTLRRCMCKELLVRHLASVLEVTRLVAPPLYGMRVPYGNRLTYFPKCDLPGLR